MPGASASSFFSRQPNVPADRPGMRKADVQGRNGSISAPARIAERLAIARGEVAEKRANAAETGLRVGRTAHQATKEANQSLEQQIGTAQKTGSGREEYDDRLGLVHLARLCPSFPAIYFSHA